MLKKTSSKKNAHCNVYLSIPDYFKFRDYLQFHSMDHTIVTKEYDKLSDYGEYINFNGLNVYMDVTANVDTVYFEYYTKNKKKK